MEVTMTKQYDAIITVEWATTIDAKNKEQFIEFVKNNWWEEYNIELKDDEIKIINEGE